MSGWSTVWDIASKRYATNLGEKTLTDHGFAVLQGYVMVEQQQAMRDALGNAFRGYRS